jgi:hypothetical protein
VRGGRQAWWGGRGAHEGGRKGWSVAGMGGWVGVFMQKAWWRVISWVCLMNHEHGEDTQVTRLDITTP